MQTITIQGNQQEINKLINLIKDNKLNLDFETTRSLDDIRAEIEDTREQIKNGTMKLYTFDEVMEHTNEILRAKGAKIWYCFLERFKSEVGFIIDFISDDSIERALNFRDDLMAKIYNIPKYPLIYRKSFLFDDDNIRELILKVMRYHLKLKKMSFTS